MRRASIRLCARLAAAAHELGNHQIGAALGILDGVKADRMAVEGTDFLRAQAFLMQQDHFAARQALLEELRAFPESADARDLLARINAQLKPFLDLPADVVKQEPIFAMCYDGIRDHTMLTWPRLLALFKGTMRACERGLEGDLVECGVAGGGSSVLMALAARHASVGNVRRVYACDTFSGMPIPTDQDTKADNSETAADTHWATGTCSGNVGHLRRLAASFDVEIVPIPGLFGDTLETLPVKQIAAFHLDADWFESTHSALTHLYPRLVPEAYVQLDDYRYWRGCYQGVEAYFKSRGIPLPAMDEIDGNAVCFRR
jgi:O-methyltransferase